MNQSKSIKAGKLFVCIGISIVILLVIARVILFYFTSDGLSGISILFPLLVIGILLFALLTSSLFAAWVYQDCKIRNDDGVLWATIVFIATPLIGLLIYSLRRFEVKKNCTTCKHKVSLNAKFCEECGAEIENREEITAMEFGRTHHMKYIVMGTVCMVLMLTCLTGFIVSAASGKGINADITSNDKVWNIGSISMNYDAHINGVWNLDFKNASDGFVKQEKMTINNSESDSLYADISCGTVAVGASLTLYLVQGDVVKSFDVTNLSDPLEHQLTDFDNGEIYVRLQIKGVENTVSEIYIK